MKRPEGLILPEEIRDGLNSAIPRLAWSQRGVAKESQVSPSLVSNLLSGNKRVKERRLVARVCAVLEQRNEDRFSSGLLNEEKYEDISDVIKRARAVFGLGLDPNEPKIRELETLMSNSLRLIIEQSALLSQTAASSLFPNSVDQTLAALRMSQMYNNVAQVILESHRNTIFHQNTLPHVSES